MSVGPDQDADSVGQADRLHPLIYVPPGAVEPDDRSAESRGQARRLDIAQEQHSEPVWIEQIQDRHLLAIDLEPPVRRRRPATAAAKNHSPP